MALWNPMLMKKTATPPVNLITSISLFGSAVSTAATVTVPLGVQAGDLLILVDLARGSVTHPVSVTPAGFTTAADNTEAMIYRQVLSYKIADGDEAGSPITGMTSSNSLVWFKMLAVFRGDMAATSVVLSAVNFQYSGAAPANQTVTASSGSAPLIACASYIGLVDAVAVRGFTPTKDGEFSVLSDALEKGWFAYKVYNSTPANVTISMADYGANFLESFYVEMKALA